MKLVTPFLFILLSAFELMACMEKPAQLTFVTRNPSVTTANPPVLVMLHGIGSNERDLFSFANEIPGDYIVISVRAPFTLGKDSYGWYHVDFSTGKAAYDFAEADQSRLQLTAFLEEIIAKQHLEKSEIYLCGFSQGAIMSYSVALMRPDLVTGVAAMSGRLLEEIKPTMQPKEAYKSLKFFISHGTEDQKIDVENARQANAFLKTLELLPEYHEYEAGHTINSMMLSDMIGWLRK